MAKVRVAGRTAIARFWTSGWVQDLPFCEEPVHATLYFLLRVGRPRSLSDLAVGNNACRLEIYATKNSICRFCPQQYSRRQSKFTNQFNHLSCASTTRPVLPVEVEGERQYLDAPHGSSARDA